MEPQGSENVREGEKTCLRRRGEPPRKRVALALRPSFLGTNRKGVRRGLRPPQRLGIVRVKSQGFKGGVACEPQLGLGPF